MKKNDDKRLLRFDIVISGATPEGLFLAYQLQRMGHHSICIFDSRHAPATDRRDLIKLPSFTMNAFHALGIAHHFANAGIALQGSRLITSPKRDGVDRTFSNTDVMPDDPFTPFPFDTLVTRSQAEHILGNLVFDSHKGAVIFWDACMTQYEDVPDMNEIKIHLTKTGANNEKEPSTIIQVQANYLIVTDILEEKPAAMAVLSRLYPDWCIESRHQGSYHSPLVSIKANCKLDGRDKDILDQQRETMIHFGCEPGICTFMLLPPSVDDGYFQIKYVDTVAAATAAGADAPTGDQEQDNGTNKAGMLSPLVSSVKDMQDIIDRTCGDLDLVVSDIQDIQQTIADSHVVLMANGFRRGRAFLLGDAAHNQHDWLGFHEATNLAWKLSFALANFPNSDVLLDSYSYEHEKLANTFLKPKDLTKVDIAKLVWDVLSVSLKKGVFHLIGYHNKANGMSNKKRTRRCLMIDMDSRLLLQNKTMATHCPSLIAPGQMIPETLPLWKRGDQQGLACASLTKIVLLGTASTSAKYTALWLCTRPSWCKRPDALTRAFWMRATAAPSGPVPLRPVVIESMRQVAQRTVLPDYAVAAIENPIHNDDDSAAALITGAFWMEEWETEYSVTRRIGLMHVLVEHKDDTDPPAALVLIRPDGYVAGSFLIRAPDEIDQALGLLTATLLA